MIDVFCKDSLNGIGSSFIIRLISIKIGGKIIVVKNLSKDYPNIITYDSRRLNGY